MGTHQHLKRQLRAVGALVYARNTHRLLFVQRSERSSYPLHWGIVGGKANFNESLKDALIREISEEIGELPPIVFSGKIKHFVSDDGRFCFDTIILVVENEFIPILNKESIGFSWAYAEYPPRPLHPRLKEILESLRGFRFYDLNDMQINKIKRAGIINE
jgi:8-oxo-dGTP pyrophosphatase MutT (NUDIX family)